MNNDNAIVSCPVGCWLIAILAGVLVAVLLAVSADWAFAPAVFAGLIVAGVAGALLNRFMCRPHSASNDGQAGDHPATQATVTAPDAKASTAAAPTSSPSAATAQPAPAAAKAKAEETPAVGAKPAAKPKPKAKPALKAVTNPAPASGGKQPETLSAARADGPDDLKQIKGVGPKLEGVLHGMGFYHFDQIAGWGADEIAWVDQNLVGFKGRVSRDAWVDQARTLAAGGATEFSKKVKKGDVY